jgi:hypothetical protein
MSPGALHCTALRDIAILPRTHITYLLAQRGRMFATICPRVDPVRASCRSMQLALKAEANNAISTVEKKKKKKKKKKRKKESCHIPRLLQLQNPKPET